MAVFTRVGIVLVLATAVSITVFFTRNESDGKDLVALVMTAAVLFNGDELSTTCFCKLFLVLRIFGGGGAFVVPANRGYPSCAVETVEGVWVGPW